MYALSFCRENTGGFFKITGNIGGFYENTGEFHQFQKYRRDWPVLQELQEIQEVVPGLPSLPVTAFERNLVKGT